MNRVYFVSYHDCKNCSQSMITIQSFLAVNSIKLMFLAQIYSTLSRYIYKWFSAESVDRSERKIDTDHSNVSFLFEVTFDQIYTILICITEMLTTDTVEKYLLFFYINVGKTKHRKDRLLVWITIRKQVSMLRQD